MTPEPREKAKIRATEDAGRIVLAWLDENYHSAHRPVPTQGEQLMLRNRIAQALAAAHARGRKEGLEEAAKVAESYAVRPGPHGVRGLVGGSGEDAARA